jgi:hypothetical protein
MSRLRESTKMQVSIPKQIPIPEEATLEAPRRVLVILSCFELV